MLTDAVWASLRGLVRSSGVQIDRPKGSRHPRFGDFVYPLDYGFLVDTVAGDGGGIDVWLGSGNRDDLVGVLVAVDGSKRDVELKLLLGCTAHEQAVALDASNRGSQNACLISRLG